jgi:hypothetical protein
MGMYMHVLESKNMVNICIMTYITSIQILQHKLIDYFFSRLLFLTQHDNNTTINCESQSIKLIKNVK